MKFGQQYFASPKICTTVHLWATVDDFESRWCNVLAVTTLPVGKWRCIAAGFLGLLQQLPGSISYDWI